VNRREAFDLLTEIARGDNRGIDEDLVDFWHRCLHDVPYDDAQAAVIAHFRTSTSWLMPAHVRTAAVKARTARIDAVPQPDPGPDLTDRPRDYARAQREQVKAIADKSTSYRALPRRAGAAPGPEARAAIERIAAKARSDPRKRAAEQAAEYRAGLGRRDTGQGAA
jgi:hypothetical protein